MDRLPVLPLPHMAEQHAFSCDSRMCPRVISLVWRTSSSALWEYRFSSTIAQTSRSPPALKAFISAPMMRRRRWSGDLLRLIS
jgi:hypothetical protein